MLRTAKNKLFFLCLAVPLGVGLISGLLILPVARPVYKGLTKPPFSPPSWLFPLAWFLLYLLMGAATWFVVTASSFQQDLHIALMLFTAQLMLSFLWPVTFFRLQLFGLAFLILCFLWFLLFLNLTVYYRISKTAGKLFLPYVLWVFYALYLNLGIIFLN